MRHARYLERARRRHGPWADVGTSPESAHWLSHLRLSRPRLASEMSPRVKNLHAIAAGLTRIAYRSSTSAAEMAKDLSTRLASLGRAHNLMRPLPVRQGTAALLADLLALPIRWQGGSSC